MVGYLFAHQPGYSRPCPSAPTRCGGDRCTSLVMSWRFQEACPIDLPFGRCRQASLPTAVCTSTSPRVPQNEIGRLPTTRVRSFIPRLANQVCAFRLVFRVSTASRLDQSALRSAFSVSHLLPVSRKQVFVGNRLVNTVHGSGAKWCGSPLIGTRCFHPFSPNLYTWRSYRNYAI